LRVDELRPGDSFPLCVPLVSQFKTRTGRGRMLGELKVLVLFIQLSPKFTLEIK